MNLKLESSQNIEKNMKTEEIDFDFDSENNEKLKKILKKKNKIIPLLRDALKSDLKAKIIEGINDELNQIETELIMKNQMQILGLMEKAYDFTQAPSWVRNQFI